MNKQLQRLLACLALCAALAGVAPVPASAASFRDVPAGHWAAESIRRCVELGFFQGRSESRFGLGEEMTRAEFAVVLCRFFDWEEVRPERPTFQDVPSDAWYAGAVEAAYANGAFTEQREVFRPNDPITREDLAVIVVRALGYSAIAGLAQELPMPFRDVNTNPGYIAMAYALGLVSGTSATAFSPKRNAPREQVAVTLARLYERLHGQGPALTAVVSAPADLAGLDVAAIPAAQLNLASGSVTITSVMDRQTSAAILEAAHQAGAQALLHMTAGPSALNADAGEAAAALAESVRSGGYNGLFLEIAKQTQDQRAAMNRLVKAAKAALGELPLYLSLEAPDGENRLADRYDYRTLADTADYLVLRIAGYEGIGGGFPVAPPDPLEEVYAAFAALRDEAESGKLSLMLTTTPSAWRKGERQELSLEDFRSLLKREDAHYSSRYACAYLIDEGRDDDDSDTLVVWYMDRRGAEARLQLARVFGAQRICLDNWNTASENLLAGLR